MRKLRRICRAIICSRRGGVFRLLRSRCRKFIVQQYTGSIGRMPEAKNCPSYLDGHCGIAAKIAGVPVPARQNGDCLLCSQQVLPRQVNRTTLTLAMRAVSAADAKLLRLKHHDVVSVESATPSVPFNPETKILKGRGVGSELWRLLQRIGIKHRPNCSCVEWADRMNRWGASGCRDNRQQIKQHMADSAANYGWGDVAKAVGNAICSGMALRLSVLDPYGSLLDEAIRRTIDSESRRIPSPDPDWSVVITTAPRKGPTLRRCLNSLCEAGFHPVVFAEPNSIETQHETHWTERRLGVWHNWLRSCRWAVDTNAKWILTVQDDAFFHPDCKAFIESLEWPDDAAAISLYTAKHYSMRTWDKSYRPKGVKPVITRYFWGSLAMVWRREILAKVITHHIARNWMGVKPKSGNIKAVMKRRKEYPERIQNSDTAIGKICCAMRRPIYFVDPSPVTHIAKHSAIGHGGNSGRRNAIRVADVTKPLWEQVFGDA